MCSVYCANLHTLSLCFFCFFRAKLEIQVRNLQCPPFLAHFIPSSSFVVSFLSGCQCEAAAPKTLPDSDMFSWHSVSKKTTPLQKKDQLWPIVKTLLLFFSSLNTTVSLSKYYDYDAFHTLIDCNCFVLKTPKRCLFCNDMKRGQCNTFTPSVAGLLSGSLVVMVLQVSLMVHGHNLLINPLHAPDMK